MKEPGTVAIIFGGIASILSLYVIYSLWDGWGYYPPFFAAIIFIVFEVILGLKFPEESWRLGYRMIMFPGLLIAIQLPAALFSMKRGIDLVYLFLSLGGWAAFSVLGFVFGKKVRRTMRS